METISIMVAPKALALATKLSRQHGINRDDILGLAAISATRPVLTRAARLLVWQQVFPSLPAPRLLALLDKR
jgi:hypothetical protein